jgi:hypothetical protein
MAVAEMTMVDDPSNRFVAPCRNTESPRELVVGLSVIFTWGLERMAKRYERKEPPVTGRATAADAPPMPPILFARSAPNSLLTKLPDNVRL